MNIQTTVLPRPAILANIRTLTPAELPLLREHLLRLDKASRRDRFNGFVDDSFIERYSRQSANDGTIILVYVEEGEIRGAAELHQPDLTVGSLPEIAFSVEASLRRRGVGSMLFEQLIAKAQSLNYQRLRITTGSQNDAMRALAGKFGAKLTFRHGESTGTIELEKLPVKTAASRKRGTWFDVQRAMFDYSKAFWTRALKPRES